jgi:hypothetical protein
MHIKVISPFYFPVNLLGGTLKCLVKQRVKYFGSLKPTW